MSDDFNWELPVVQCDACGCHSDSDGGWVLARDHPELKEDAWICRDCKVIDLRGTEFWKEI